MEFNWDLNEEEKALVNLIVDRAVDLCAEHEIEVGDRVELTMDITTTHNHACKLDLEKFLNAEDMDFAHDLMLITNTLNRNTGQLENGAIPRCVKREG
ncbi:hypothetical protein [Desulfovibrio sp. JC010]|uniref:DUF6874 family protein n=1 Tax=Desulfovibrio sp. JC010 TaxID=2593641 RepID=UPI0013D6F17A|nr:hypothetical protein [Desulfovibrio sp. JC010]NDV27741.1 hypothetical protein [Desulfovibrio sp. JC010]